MGETEATDQRHTICVGSRRKGGSILQAKSCNVSGEKESDFVFSSIKGESLDRTNHVQARREKQIERGPWQKAEFK